MTTPSDALDPPTGPPATPFWLRMPRFFAFPAYAGPLLRNLAAAAACALVGWIATQMVVESPLRAMLTGALVYAAVSFAITRYGFDVIERTSVGYLSPGQYPPQHDGASTARAAKLFGILLVVPIAIAIVSAVLGSPALMLLMMLAFAAMLPATVIVLTLTDSAADAVNPLRCLDTAQRIGAPYVVLCLFLLFLMIGSSQAFEWVLPRLLPGEATMRQAAARASSPAELVSSAAGTVAAIAGVAVFVGNWFFLTMCVLIGYAMYQYAAPLGITVVGPGDAGSGLRLGAEGHRRRVRDALIGQMVARGEIREAIDMISSDLGDRPNDLSLHARLHRLLLAEGSGPRIEDHAQRYLELLMNSGNLREALDLVEQTIARQPGFEPRPVGRLLPLARAALEASRIKLATALVRGFDKRFPGHPDIPAAYLVGAQILLQDGRDADRARRMLEHVKSAFAGTPAAAEAGRYLERLQRLAPAHPPG